LPDDEIADSLIRHAVSDIKLPLGLDAYALYINNERIRRGKLIGDFAADVSVDNPAIIRDIKGIHAGINFKESRIHSPCMKVRYFEQYSLHMIASIFSSPGIRYKQE
jgi:hypothetical protein